MKTITIVGVGALGSHLALFLRNVANLKIIDFDRVEQKNTLSQFHAKTTVGQSKVESFRKTVQFLWGLKVDVVPHKLVANNTEALLSNTNLIVDCLDNAEARKLISAFSTKSGIPALHGALAPGGQFGRVVWNDYFNIDSEAGMGGATCEDGAHLPFIALTSSYLAYSAQLFIEKGKKRGFEITPVSVTQT